MSSRIAPGIFLRLARMVWAIFLLGGSIVLSAVLASALPVVDPSDWGAFALAFFLVLWLSFGGLVLLEHYLLGGSTSSYNPFLVEWVLELPDTLAARAEKKRALLAEIAAIDSLADEIDALDPDKRDT